MNAMSRTQICLYFISIGLLCTSVLVPPAFTVVAATDRNAQNDQDVQVVFAKHCASCHGKDGRAKTFKGKLSSARNLTDPKWQDSVTDERIFNSIANGRGKMPSFNKKLTDAEIDKLAAYVRTLKK